MNQIPDTIKRYLADEQYTLDTIGMSGAQILLFPDQVLKIQSASPEAEREVQMMEWCAGKLPVPRVLAHMVEQQTSYLLMTRAKGVMSCDGSYMEQPEVLTEVLADGLQRLWQVDVTDCPSRQMLAQKRRARYLWTGRVCRSTGIAGLAVCKPTGRGIGTVSRRFLPA